MASINYAAREISVKIVYYGPGLSGKTTNLQVIHKKVPPEYKSDMVSLATETDRTLFFDFLPLDLGTIKGFSTKFQLYTVPGQVYYNATRKLVLRGVDGIIFVADSQAEKINEDLESFQNLEDNLIEYGYQRENIPIIIQYNKRDLPGVLPVEKLNSLLNKYNCEFNEAIAARSIGVFESLKMMGKLVIDNLNLKYSHAARSSSPASVTFTPQPSRAATPGSSPARQAPQQAAPFVPPAPIAQTQAWSPTRPQAAMQPTPPPRAPQPLKTTAGFDDDPFVNISTSPTASAPVENPVAAPAMRPSAPQQTANNYWDNSMITLEPMDKSMPPPAKHPQSQPAPAPFYDQQPVQPDHGSMEKNELDLEIERYQREIKEKHTGTYPVVEPQQNPQRPQYAAPAPTQPPLPQQNRNYADS
ncbi:MAG: ADP-ribosylation factor-like protein, partial [Chitinivibrionales bacterium]|nr:ADP-ribosylation factor-like protein [Chitinivibrionales bacterium]